MAGLISDISDLSEDAPRQLALNAEAVAHHVRYDEIRINREDVAERRRRRCGAAANIRQITVLELRAVGKGRDVDRREDDVTFGSVVKDAEAAANRGLVVAGRRIR